MASNLSTQNLEKTEKQKIQVAQVPNYNAIDKIKIRVQPIESRRIVTKEVRKIPNTSLIDNSQREHDLKRPQMSWNADSSITHTTKKKSKLKSVSMHEINDEYIDEIIHNNNVHGLHYNPSAFII